MSGENSLKHQCGVTWFVLVLCMASCCLSRPIQLVAPDESHKNLVILENSLEELRKIPGPVSVVSVVGAIHTGKSYLLNQLMGSPHGGFKLGYSVDPQTSGLWWWSEPLSLNSTNIVFLDTEGFYGPNASSDYDSKVFSMALLLSSDVVYNSVKLIDQNALDNLELLVRRANLFGIRAHSFSNGSVAQLVESLRPSGLSWVVQDFVQDLNGASPTYWLEKLMESKHRGEEQGSHQLREYFSRVNCVVMPPPSGHAKDLQKLDSVNESLLNKEYVAGIVDWREQFLLETTRYPKLKGENKTMSGADLADLIRFLVRASHHSGVPKPPESIWAQYARLQVELTKNDMVHLYESEMDREINGGNSEGGSRIPVCEDDLKNLHEKTIQRVFLVWQRMTIGLDLVWTRAASAKLETELDRHWKIAQRMNCENLSDFCNRWKDYVLVEFDDRLDDILVEFPLPLQELRPQLAEIKLFISNKLVQSLDEENPRIANSDCCKASIIQLDQKTQNRLLELEANNSHQIAETFSKAHQTAIDKIKKIELQALEFPQTRLRDFVEQTKDNATYEYKSLLGHLVNSEEMHEKAYRFKSTLDEALSRLENSWNSQCRNKGNELAQRLEETFFDSIVTNIAFPTEEGVLSERIKKARSDAWTNFNSLYCSTSEGSRLAAKNLESWLRVREEELDRRNVDALKRLVQTPLDKAKQKCQAEFYKYYTLWQLRRYVLAIGENEIRQVAASSSSASSSAGGGSNEAVSPMLTPKVLERWWVSEIRPLAYPVVITNDVMALIYVSSVALLFIYITSYWTRGQYFRFVAASVTLSSILFLFFFPPTAVSRAGSIAHLAMQHATVLLDKVMQKLGYTVVVLALSLAALRYCHRLLDVPWPWKQQHPPQRSTPCEESTRCSVSSHDSIPNRYIYNHANKSSGYNRENQARGGLVRRMHGSMNDALSFGGNCSHGIGMSRNQVVLAVLVVAPCFAMTAAGIPHPPLVVQREALG